MNAKFKPKHSKPSESASGYLIVGIYDDDDFTSPASELDSKTNGTITALISNSDLGKKTGSCVLIPLISGIAAKRILVVRLGPRSDFDEKNFNKVLHGVAKNLASFTADSVSICLSDIDIEGRDLAWMARRVTEVLSFHFYKFDQLKSVDKSNNPPSKKWKVKITTEIFDEIENIRDGVRVGKAISHGVAVSRELGNLPGNICTPTHLANEARKLSRYENICVEVLEEDEMEELGMGSLLSVSRGSREPAKLIVINYQGGPDDMQPVVFVGKGLTFDAGGISIKPASKMDEMKFDMCGGAGVIGAMIAIAKLNLPVNVIGAIASSENLPDGAANKPGDIVTSMSGQTIEILNTDAEGRLILCDTLTYIGKYNPDVVIDAATLTGACVIALGRHPSGLFCNDKDLTEALVNAGRTSNDPVWPMPMWDEYQTQLDSNFADMANIGGPDGGAITAACFLARFTKEFRWAHLDIAGTAWLTGKAKGSTGRPVSLFVQFVLDRC